jgi:hypothetical protein
VGRIGHQGPEIAAGDRRSPVGAPRRRQGWRDEERIA